MGRKLHHGRHVGKQYVRPAVQMASQQAIKLAGWMTGNLTRHSGMPADKRAIPQAGSPASTSAGQPASRLDDK
jgi:hypothetical protein